jgi:hypothetical protein
MRLGLAVENWRPSATMSGVLTLTPRPGRGAADRQRHNRRRGYRTGRRGGKALAGFRGRRQRDNGFKVDLGRHSVMQARRWRDALA